MIQLLIAPLAVQTQKRRAHSEMEAVFAVMFTESPQLKGCFHIGDSVKVEEHSSWHAHGSGPKKTSTPFKIQGTYSTVTLGRHVCHKQTVFMTLQREGNQPELSSASCPLPLQEDCASFYILQRFLYLWCCRSSWNSWGSGCRAPCLSCPDTASPHWATGGCTLSALDCWFWYRAETEIPL